MAEFEHEPAKAASNKRKHGVTFEEAESMWNDSPESFFDPEHSDFEHRYIAIGFSARGRLLTVSLTYRTGGTVRIISARKATNKEVARYEKAKREKGQI